MALTDEQIRKMYEGTEEEKLRASIIAFYASNDQESLLITEHMENICLILGISIDRSECIGPSHYVQRVENELAERSAKIRFEQIQRNIRGEGVHFYAEDKATIQEKLDQLRESINGVGIESSHRKRILDKLNKLQAEIDKETTNYQLFLGVVTDLGLSLGSFGENAKPAVDRLKELMTFSIHIKVEQEQLPFSPKMPLPDDSIREETKDESDDDEGTCHK